MSNLLQEQIAVSDYAMPLPFQATNIGDADGTAKAVEPSSNEYVMPCDGYIIGGSVRQNAALSTGSLAWSPTVNGTAKTALTLTTDATHQQAYKNVGAMIPFKAGDRIGLGWVKTGTVSATTTDAAALLFIVLRDVPL